MAAKHNNGKRIIRRCLEELRATAQIARVTSVTGALATFLAKIDIQCMNRNGFREPPSVKKRLLRKHDVMLEYFEKTFAAFLEGYDVEKPLPESAPEGRIWLCWWQGEENAPELVKACIKSVRDNGLNREVTLITKENYASFVRIPAWAEEKFRRGIISPTHYSDILRLCLLAEYGGVWLDASMYCAAPIGGEELPFWSVKRPDYLHCSVAGGNFATYAMGCDAEHRWVFAILRDLLLHYWEENDMLVDYLLLDYLVVLAQRRCPRLAEVFGAIQPNNPACDELMKVLDQPYDRALWEEMKKDTYLFKLTWKQTFPKETDGSPTFYAMLLRGTLK